MNTTEFIEKIGAYVQKYAPAYGICVHSPIIAQAVLESARGTSELAVKSNNYFGLKYKPGRCPTATGSYAKVGSETKGRWNIRISHDAMVCIPGHGSMRERVF